MGQLTCQLQWWQSANLPLTKVPDSGRLVDSEHWRRISLLLLIQHIMHPAMPSARYSPTYSKTDNEPSVGGMIMVVPFPTWSGFEWRLVTLTGLSSATNPTSLLNSGWWILFKLQTVISPTRKNTKNASVKAAEKCFLHNCPYLLLGGLPIIVSNVIEIGSLISFSWVGLLKPSNSFLTKKCVISKQPDTLHWKAIPIKYVLAVDHARPLTDMYATNCTTWSREGVQELSNWNS